MTTAPFVELRFNPTDLRPRDLPRAGAYLGSPADALEAALAVTRAAMVDQMKSEMRGIGQPTEAQLLRIADLAWQAAFWRFRKISAPIVADAYVRAYRKADAGDVPMSVIYDLADKHVEKIGEYFHTSSRTALAEGFNGMVNRRLPAKAAADRVLDAFGLTSRQMRAYTAAKQFETPVTDVLPRSLKAKARAYIDRAFTSRTKKLSKQEEHNIDQQAQQFAWMWLQDKDRLSERAEKLWITARDERVCEICGPLHGKKVKVNEQFKTAHGEFWTPGLHPNCRCVVRLLEHKFSKALVGTALAEFNEEHPRGEAGRFGTKTRVKTAQEPRRITALQRTHDPVLERQFHEVIAGSIRPQAVASRAPARGDVVFRSPQAKLAPVQTEVARPAPAKVKSVQALARTTQPKAKLKPDTGVRVLQPGTRAPTDPGRQTVYTVLPGAAFGTGNVALEMGRKLHVDPRLAEAEAGEMLDKAINTEVQRLRGLEDSGNLHDVSGGSFKTFPLSDADLRKVVEWHAGQARTENLMQNPEFASHPPDPMKDEGAVTSTWTNQRGAELGEQSLSYRYIGTVLGVDTSNLDVRVVQSDSGISGKYEAVPESMNIAETETLPVTRMRVRPTDTPEQTVDRMKLLEQHLKALEQKKKRD